jgi:hypothetical protein
VTTTLIFLFATCLSLMAMQWHSAHHYAESLCLFWGVISPGPAPGEENIEEDQ